jgi:hypothetical protein
MAKKADKGRWSWDTYAARYAEKCRGAKSIEEVRGRLGLIMEKEPSDRTVLNVAYSLGIKGAGSALWKASKKKYVEACWDANSVDEVRERLGRMMKNKPSEWTVLMVARMAGIKGAGRATWERVTKKYLEACKGARTPEDVRLRLSQIMKKEPTKGTVREIARRLGIRSEREWSPKEGAEKRAAQRAAIVLEDTVGRLQRGTNVNLMPLRQDVRMAAGEQFACLLLGRRLTARQVRQQLSKQGFIDDEVSEVMKEIVARKRNLKRAPVPPSAS